MKSSFIRIEGRKFRVYVKPDGTGQLRQAQRFTGTYYDVFLSLSMDH